MGAAGGQRRPVTCNLGGRPPALFFLGDLSGDGRGAEKPAWVNHLLLAIFVAHPDKCRCRSTTRASGGASASTERFRCRPPCWNRRGGKATHHPSLRRACGAREVGGVADERGDGGNPVADQPIRTLAEPPSDLSTIGTADVPAHLAQFAAAYLSRPQMRRLAVIVSRWKGRHLAVTS